MKFCPMCGQKVIPSSKFCNGCGLNLVEYRQKLERLAKSETLTENNLLREASIIALKNSAETTSTRPQVNESQEFVSSLYERFGSLRQVYFNVSGGKNLLKIKSAIKAYALKAANEQVIFVLDDTFFGGGEDGFLVTTENIYVHNMDAKAFVVPWYEIQTFEPKFKQLGQRISINGEQEIFLSGYSQVELNTLFELLDEIKAAFGGQVSVAPKKKSPLRREEKLSPTQPISQETLRNDEPTEELTYYTPPPSFTPPPPKNFLDKPYIKNETECRTEDQKHMLENFQEAIHYLNSHEDDDFPTIKSAMQKSALSTIHSAAYDGYMPAIYLSGHICFDGYLMEKDWINAKRYFEEFAVYGEDEDDKISQRLIALGRFSTIMRHNPKIRVDILKPEVFHYYLRELLETSVASDYPLKCVYFNTSHCDRKTLKKINSALEVYVGQLKEYEFPLIVFDPTTFGSAIAGCLFSNFGIYVRNGGEKNTHFIDYESYETKDITIRGLILKDVYVGEQKIETSSCGYGDSERTTFAYIVRDMGGVFGKR